MHTPNCCQLWQLALICRWYCRTSSTGSTTPLRLLHLPTRATNLTWLGFSLPTLMIGPAGSIVYQGMCRMSSTSRQVAIPFVFRMQINWRCSLHSFCLPDRMGPSCVATFSLILRKRQTNIAGWGIPCPIKLSVESTKCSYGVTNDVKVQWKLRTGSPRLDMGEMDEIFDRVKWAVDLKTACRTSSTEITLSRGGQMQNFILNFIFI